MGTPLNTLVEVTNAHGSIVLAETEITEPEPGSIVLVHGEFGTAWQRQFKDGMWVRVGGGRPRDWHWLLMQPRVHLAYDAPVRPEAVKVEPEPYPAADNGHGYWGKD